MEKFRFLSPDKAPQRDVPNELIVHKIVADYQRMFNENEQMIREIKSLNAKLKKKENRIRDLERMVANLKKK